jgi:hypothetical protein
LNIYTRAITGKSLSELENERKQAILKGKLTYKSIDEDKWNTFKFRLLLLLRDIWQNNLRIFCYNYLNPLNWFGEKAEYIWTETPLDLG